MSDVPDGGGGKLPVRSNSTALILIAVAVVAVLGGCCVIGGAATLFLRARPATPQQGETGGDVAALEAAQASFSAMEIMENGQWVGRIDADGSIWRNSQNVGSIDAQGNVSGSAQGSVDPSSGYIMDGSQIGYVAEDGNFFAPTNVGYIAEDGNIFFGTHWGQVQGYTSTPLNRAAVTAYLHFFARAF
jgi:hypothetical protein